MLRRSTSRSGSSLSHSRSSASVRSAAVYDLQHISPADAIRDAHVAATVSFARARNQTGASIISHPRHSSNGNGRDIDVAIGPRLHHRRSVRFVKPTTGARGSASSRASDTWDHNGRSLPLNDLRSSENRFLNRGPLLCDTSGAQGREDAYFRALQASDNYCTPEDNICSVPSSYRRLRKSKSMFTPSTASEANDRFDCRFSSHQGFKTHTLRAGMVDDKENQRPSRGSHQLKAPKSMSFLNTRPDIPVRRFIQKENDAAVEMARDMFKKTAQHQEQLKSYPSRFFRSKRRSGFSSESHRSMRTSSITTVPISLSSSNLSISKGSVSSKVRKVSTNLKSKLKRFLHINNKDSIEYPLTPNIDPTERVSMSLEAPHTQPAGGHLSPYNGHVQRPTDYTINSVASRIPSFREVPSSLKSRHCSWESLHSDHRSVVDGSSSGSWTNPGNDATSGFASQDWEHHRLSVIKENGNHLSSSDHKSIGLNLGRQSYAEASGPGAPSNTLTAPQPVVSGERVYSALMRHQREKSANTMDSSVPAASTVIDNSQCSIEAEIRSPLTIRCVKPEDDVFVDRSTTSSQSGSRLSTLRGSRTSSTGSIVRKPLPPSSYSRLTQGHGSAFGSSPNDFLFRTGSPYRRSLQDAMRVADATAPISPGASYMFSMSHIDLPPRCPSAPESVAGNEVDYTSSVYSSATASPQEPVLDITEKTVVSSHSVLGSAAVTSHEDSYRPSLPKDGMASDPSSWEWKSWLSSKMAKLEESGWGRVSPTNPGLKGMTSAKSPGHVRQGAEVDSPDTEPSATGSSPCSPSQITAQNTPQGLTVSQDANFNEPTAQGGPAPNQNEHSVSDIQSEERKSIEEAGSPPPIPRRSGLRQTPSLPCIRTPSNRIEGRLPKSTPRPSSFLDGASPGLRRRPGIRLARKARAGLNPDATLSCIGNESWPTGVATKISSSMPSSPDGKIARTEPSTP